MSLVEFAVLTVAGKAAEKLIKFVRMWQVAQGQKMAELAVPAVGGQALHILNFAVAWLSRRGGIP